MADPKDDFFIGWASPSRSTLIFLAVVTGVLVLGFAGAAAAVTHLQSSPGASVRQWNESFTGVYRTAPYGHLVVPTEDGPVTVLLSSGGKRGLQGRFTDKADQVVRASGLRMDRDGRRYLELGRSFEDAELSADQLATVTDLEWEDLGQVELSGEIVDSKCYFGRMRPGSGKGHRACAQLCVRGGVPPVLVTHAPDGRRSHVVVAGPDLRDVHLEILDYVAEPITVAGRLKRKGDLFVLELPGTSEAELAAAFTRLWPDLR